jgi:mono/diheme cytochrome c family protein
MVWRQLQKHRATWAGAAAGAMLALFVFSATGSQLGAQSAQSGAKPGEVAILSLGGRLYDNHWAVLGRRPPSRWQPLFPQNVKIAPSETWRCVSCHGWDYRGAEGHLGKVSKDPALKSLAGVAGRDPQQIVATLESAPHNEITANMPPALLLALAKFLSYGQQDMADLVDAEGKATGDPMHGKDIFEGTCARCHDADGKAPIYGEQGDQPSLGWIVRHRPEQAVHKIRNGVPVADMLSLRFLDMKSLSGLLGYLQTLDPGP